LKYEKIIFHNKTAWKALEILFIVYIYELKKSGCMDVGFAISAISSQKL